MSSHHIFLGLPRCRLYFANKAILCSFINTPVIIFLHEIATQTYLNIITLYLFFSKQVKRVQMMYTHVRPALLKEK